MIEQNFFLNGLNLLETTMELLYHLLMRKLKGDYSMLEIEVEGAKQIKEKFHFLSIFLLPPNKAELERRIRNRGTEKEESNKKRLSRASYEISVSNQFDFALTNHDVNETAKG